MYVCTCYLLQMQLECPNMYTVSGHTTCKCSSPPIFTKSYKELFLDQFY